MVIYIILALILAAVLTWKDDITCMSIPMKRTQPTFNIYENELRSLIFNLNITQFLVRRKKHMLQDLYDRTHNDYKPAIVEILKDGVYIKWSNGMTARSDITDYEYKRLI